MKPIDLPALHWIECSGTRGSVGMLNKAMAQQDGVLVYYKISCMQGSAVVGYESVFEVIASRYLEVLGIAHVPYDLLYARVNVKGKVFTTWLCCSRDYKPLCGETIAALDFCSSAANAEQEILRAVPSYELYTLYLVDFLIANVDRHGGNTELYRDKQGSWHIVPLFDHGCSMLHWAPNADSVRHYNVMQARNTDNFIGDEDLYANLGKIKTPILVNALRPQAKRYIMCNLSLAMPREIIDKTWELLQRRYEYAKEKGFLVER